ncbi:MAG: hypothetical protein ACM3SY_12455 [Candidatus Omnitrophota bacterium]
MRTYEDFLTFLEKHLTPLTDFIPASDDDFHPICHALARFMLSEPYRWENLLNEWPVLPTNVPKPAENELLDFFKNNKGLPLSFGKELQENQCEKLYTAYNVLYPIFVLKDDFLTSIFRKESHSRKYKKIVREGETKINRIIERINALKTNQEFTQFMSRFTAELSGFSLTLINNKKLLDTVVDKLAEAK